MSIFDGVLEILGALLIVATWYLLLTNYWVLPEQVPVHYDFWGKPKHITLLSLMVLLLVSCNQTKKNNNMANSTTDSLNFKSGYADVNGLKMYYEIHGNGEPLILLHGGLYSINMYTPIISILSKNRQVIAVDLQGHGRTADINRSLRFETMADDIAALIKFLNLGKVDIAGHSLNFATTTNN